MNSISSMLPRLIAATLLAVELVATPAICEESITENSSARLIAASSPVPAPTKQQLPPPSLSAETMDVVKDIGLQDLLEELLNKRSQAVASGGSPRTIDTVYLHSKIVARLLATSLQVRGTAAQIDQEITQSQELLSSLQQKTNRRVDLAEIFNFMNTGTAETISTGVGLSTSSLKIPAACVGAYGGAMEIALSALALKLANGQRSDSELQPNMLAKVFGHDGAELDYPPVVWAYLNDRNPGFPTTQTRLEKLVEHWTASKHIPSPKSRNSKDEISILTGNKAKKKAITIDLLGRRIMMLSDLKSTIRELDEELLKIVLWLNQMM